MGDVSSPKNLQTLNADLKFQLAQRKENPERVKELLSKGASLFNPPCNVRDSMLFRAVQNSASLSAQTLVEAGAHIEMDHIFEAACHANFQLVQYLVANIIKLSEEHGTKSANIKDMKIAVDRVLQYATLPENERALQNDEDLREQGVRAVEELLKAGSSPNDGQRGANSLPLLSACSYPGLEMLKLLLKYGADPNKTMSGDPANGVLLCAAARGRFDIYDYLRKEVGVPFPPGLMNNLMLSSRIMLPQDELERVMSGPDAQSIYLYKQSSNSESFGCYNPVHLAILSLHSDDQLWFDYVISFLKLCKSKGMDINMVDDVTKATALSCILTPNSHHVWRSSAKNSITSQQLITLIDFILSIGGKINMEVASPNANNPEFLLHNLLLKGRSDVVDHILKKGYDASRAFSRLGLTGIMVCARANDPIHNDTLKKIIGKKYDLNAQDHEGNTALHYAALNDNAAAYSLLSKAGASITIKNNAGFTPPEMAPPGTDVKEFTTSGKYTELPIKITPQTISKKFVLLADGASGKTCLLISYTTGAFPSEYIPTVFDNYSCNINFRGQSMNIGLWDTAPREDGMRLLPLSFPGTDVFFMCFSVVSPNSLQSILTTWYPCVEHHCPTAKKLLVGLKSDLRNDKETLQRLADKKLEPVTPLQAQEVAQKIGAHGYVECSALTQQGLSVVFNRAMYISLMEDQKPGRSQKHQKSCSFL